MLEVGGGLRRANSKLIIIVSGLIIAALAGAAGFFFWQYTTLKNNPDAAAQETTKRLVSQVEKLYQIPKDEQPTVAQVKDKEKLKDQPFFKNAVNGDYILIFTNNKIAIVYREKDNKLINVGPIAINEPQAGGTTTPTTAAKSTVKVINGNKTNRAAAVSADITTKLGAQVTVDTTYGDAKSKTVVKSIVVDVKGTNPTLAKQIADSIGGTVGSLPAGETKPSTDFLVIVGQ